jgi:hypothetical protein
LLAACVSVFCMPAAASADSDLAHMALKDVDRCDSPDAWFLVNDLKNSPVTATVHIHWDQGTEHGDQEFVETVGAGESKFIKCRWVKFPYSSAPMLERPRAWVVDAEQS